MKYLKVLGVIGISYIAVGIFVVTVTTYMKIGSILLFSIESYFSPLFWSWAIV